MVAISVIMSVYSEPLDWIRHSIDSILNQTLTDFEFIIINDNPLDVNVKEFLQNYAKRDCRIKLINNKNNIGLTKSLNIGISEAKGKYVARMDADDIALSERLQYQYDYMEQHPEIDVCGTWALLFGDISTFSNKKLKMPVSNNLIQIQAFTYTPMIHPSVMLRMERLPIKLYDERYTKAQDYALWGYLIENGFVLHNLPKYLMRYRITAKSSKNNYRSQQFSTADSIRTRLIKEIFPNCTESDISLHNKICNELSCNLKEAEKWLLNLRNLLSERYSDNKSDISTLIARLWINICLTNGVRLSDYRKSNLANRLSFFNYLRFAKRAQLF